MAHNHHKSKNLTDLFNCIFSGRVLEKRNKHIFQPICVKSWLFIENLENCQNTWVFELSEPSFHKFEEFLSHFITEKFICPFVISEKDKFKITWIKLINFLFDFLIHFFPEFFMFAIEFLHQMIKLHQIFSFYFLKVFIYVFESLTYPRMLIPIMLLLTFDSW